jgi:rod shape-determining protein MreD
MEMSRLRKNIYIGIWIFLLVIFQTSVCCYWDIAGIYPNIIFVFVICFAVLEKSFAYCVSVPIICGFIIDSLCGYTMLYGVLFFSMSSLICYAVGEHFFKEKLVFAVPAVFVLTFASEFIYMIISGKISASYEIVNGVRNVILPLAAYNTVMTFVIYPLCRLSIYKKIRPKLIKKVRKRY